MFNALTELLSRNGTLLADGATGTNLFAAGLMSGDAPELWNEQEPAKITALYKGAVDAGSDVFLTNSFGANASRLKLHDAGHRAFELSRIAAELARNVADRAGRTVIVAGSVGPTGEIMEPVGSLTHSDAVEMFHETAAGLKAGGADIGWLETISAPEEYAAAAEGFARAELPWVGTMSFDTAGRTMMGVTSTDMVDMVNALPNRPTAFGANCGTGASDLLRTVLGFASTGTEIPLIAKGNAGIPKYHDGHIHYDGTPALMADYAVLARDCGASIIGGCCGTTPEHLVAMRAALDTRPRKAAPKLEDIVAALGAFSSPSDGTGGSTPLPRKRRGRRAAA
ncbi:betaine--homocysteine S-methyltransferase [uncultured Tateyamaria sp.]|uniref:betaine--homocysteine S-methyltransferase n=1 Tax=uncultured Tateyamaria sp. TaxID=455651 RepID=UPI00261136FD|nr:betaine--homocysteine S-methyltransferase [uncultured Tateyamaria sp.]